MERLSYDKEPQSWEAASSCQDDPEALADRNSPFVEIVNLMNVHSEMRHTSSFQMRQGVGAEEK